MHRGLSPTENRSIDIVERVRLPLTDNTVRLYGWTKQNDYTASLMRVISLTATVGRLPEYWLAADGIRLAGCMVGPARRADLAAPPGVRHGEGVIHGEGPLCIHRGYSGGNHTIFTPGGHLII